MKVQIFEDIVSKRRKLRKQGFNFLHKYFRYKEKNYIQSKNVLSSFFYIYGIEP